MSEKANHGYSFFWSKQSTSDVVEKTLFHKHCQALLGAGHTALQLVSNRTTPESVGEPLQRLKKTLIPVFFSAVDVGHAVNARHDQTIGVAALDLPSDKWKHALFGRLPRPTPYIPPCWLSSLALFGQALVKNTTRTATVRPCGKSGVWDWPQCLDGAEDTLAKQHT